MVPQSSLMTENPVYRTRAWSCTTDEWTCLGSYSKFLAEVGVKHT